MRTEKGTFLSSTDGTMLVWQAWLPESPPKALVVLAHGYGEHCDRYGHVGEAMTSAGYALYALDHRGHGRSGGERGVIPDYNSFLDDFGALIGMAQTDQPGLTCFIYGHSMGGNIALVYALTRPDDLAGVIATGPLLKFSVEPSGLKVALANVLDKVAPNFSLSGNVASSSICRDETVVKAYEDDPLVHDKLSMRLGKEMITYGDYSLDHATDLAIPALLMHGSEDQLTSPAATRRFADRASRAQDADVTYIEYPGLYHELHNEPEQDQVFADMIAWLDART